MLLCTRERERERTTETVCLLRSFVLCTLKTCSLQHSIFLSRAGTAHALSRAARMRSLSQLSSSALFISYSHVFGQNVRNFRGERTCVAAERNKEKKN